MMHVSKPGREQVAAVLAASGNQQTRMSDLATVVYFVSGSATGVLQHAVTTPGLARLEGDRLALSMADKQSNTAATAARTEILAPEVIALRFMYFDGFRWRADWDSKVLGGSPKPLTWKWRSVRRPAVRGRGFREQAPPPRASIGSSSPSRWPSRLTRLPSSHNEKRHPHEQIPRSD